MYQYRGPVSQTVLNTWHNTNDQWHFMLAQEGYLVYSVDGRGTGGKGVEFKKQTYLDLGKLEVEDQIGAAREIAKLPYVDENRIRSEEHTSELQSRGQLVCRLLL